MNYFDLPDDLFRFIKKVDHQKISGDKAGHSWSVIPTETFLTKEGFDWFKSKKILIRNNAILFGIGKHFEGPIHMDSYDDSYSTFAINFVLDGFGEMQWVENLEATPVSSLHNQVPYVRYENIKSYTIADIWKGNIGIVRINKPHRIVTTDSNRYCLSIRTTLKVYPITFEDAVDMLYNS